MNNTIYVITLFGANNIGAFLQSYCTERIISRLGYKVEFLSLQSSNSRKNFFSLILKSLLNNGIRKSIFKYKMKKAIFSSLTKITIVDKTVLDDKSVIVVGSDECWNLSSKSFFHYKEYFGEDLKYKKIISLSSSCNGCDIEYFTKCNYVDFKKFSNISVRDNYTKNIVKCISGIDSEKILDPTIIDSEILNYCEKSCKYNNFILIYSYGLTKKQIRDIKLFSKKMNMKTISVGNYNSFADINIVATPLQFLDYLSKATYVITSTFHGTILSVHFNKKVFIYTNGSNKIIDFIEDFNLYDISDLSNNSLESSLMSNIDYSKINKKIESEIEKANLYLSKSLG